MAGYPPKRKALKFSSVFGKIFPSSTTVEAGTERLVKAVTAGEEVDLPRLAFPAGHVTYSALFGNQEPDLRIEMNGKGHGT
jgi:hypothetical protein